MRLEGKRAIVTGAASGFGFGIAKRLLAEGARVAFADINGRGAEDAAHGAGDRAIAVGCDVALAADVEALVEATVAAFGGVDVVVNNAGISHLNRPMLEVGEDEYDRVFDVNVKSIFLMAHAAVPVLRRQGTGGVIVNVGSTAGIRPRPGLVWYNASKGAVNALTKAMAIELAPDRIRVVGLAPVAGATPLLATFMGKPDTPENRAAFIASIPLGRLSEPADVAAATVFLASDEAAFLTGNVVEVDGGRCI